MIDPEALIHDYLDDTLSAAGQDELHAWLIEDAAHMQCFTAALMLDQEIRRAVHAKEAVALADRFLTSSASRPSTTRPLKKSSPRLARAALWLGAFTWLGNKAQAATTATTLLMTKTTTTTIITASLLLVGGGTIYQLNEKSQKARASVAELLEKKQALLTSSSTSAATRSTTRASPKTSSPLSNTAYLNRLKNSMQTVQLGGTTVTQVGGPVFDEMDEMDLETLKELVIEAHKMQISSQILEKILNKIAERSLADAAALSAQVFTDLPHETFCRLENNFIGYLKNWTETDPVAAEQWYAEAMASAEFNPKGILDEKQKSRTPHRIIARSRFSGILELDPERAVSIAKEIESEDVVIAMTSYSRDRTKPHLDPSVISRIAKQLPPAQQKEALTDFVDRKVRDDCAGAAKWLDAFGLDETLRASLLSQSAFAGYANRSISKPEALQIIDALPPYPEREKARRAIEAHILHPLPTP